jgi:tetratricopeptide (TPR) repeat protein
VQAPSDASSGHSSRINHAVGAPARADRSMTDGSGPRQQSEAAAPVRDSRELFTRGSERLRAGDVQGAIRDLTQAVAKQPDDPTFSLKLAEAYVAAGQLEEAERLLALLSARRRDDTNVPRALADLLARRGQWRRAAQALAAIEAQLAPEALLCLADYQRKAGDPAGSAATLERGASRFPSEEPLWLAWIDAALAGGQFFTALERIERARDATRDSVSLQFRAARALFALGRALGDTEVRIIPEGRPGQFRENRLLVEARGAGRFLCCPPDSALYQLRLALDGGLDEPAAHVLHARIWQHARRPDIGRAILLSREAALLEAPDDAVLEAFAALALDVGDINAFLRHSRMRADRQPERRAALLLRAYLDAAEYYGQRGEELLHVEWLRRAAAIDSEDVELLLKLADAEWALHRMEAAAAIYERILRSSPGHPAQARISRRLGEWLESSERR